MSDPPRNVRPKSLLGAQYFLYFGVMGIFLPYFNLYCAEIGLSKTRIGLLSAIRSLCLMVFPVVFGFLADRLHLRRRIFILCNWISTLVWTALFFVTDFPGLFVILTLYSIFYAPIIAFIEAYAMDALGADKERYGRLRVWGTGSFIAMTLFIGYILSFNDSRFILFAIFGGSLLMALLAGGLPRGETSRPIKITLPALTHISRPLLFFLSSAFLMLVSHATYYGFFTIHLAALGFSAPFIGGAWALASLSEMMVMIFFNRLCARVNIRLILLGSLFLAALRWVMLGSSTWAPVILLSQLLHAGTYAAFHIASILYIDQLMPEPLKTTGQALNNAATYGCGLMAGFALSGWLYDITGPLALFGGSAVLALAGALIFGLGLLLSPKMEDRSVPHD